MTFVTLHPTVIYDMLMQTENMSLGQGARLSDAACNLTGDISSGDLKESIHFISQ